MAIGVLLAFEATQTDFDRSFPTGHPLNGGQQPQLPSQPQSAAAQPRRRLSLTKQTPSAHAVVLAGPLPNGFERNERLRRSTVVRAPPSGTSSAGAGTPKNRSRQSAAVLARIVELGSSGDPNPSLNPSLNPSPNPNPNPNPRRARQWRGDGRGDRRGPLPRGLHHEHR